MKRVKTSELREGMIARESVFVPDSIVPIVHEDTVLNSHILDLFSLHGITSVFANDPCEADTEILPEVKPIIDEKLRDEALGSIRRMFTIVKAGTSEENMTTAYQAVKEIGDVVDELVDALSAEVSDLVHITGIKSYDDYTYHHSLSVAVLSIAIARSLDLSDEDQKDIGRSAMLHDIGKTLLPVELINKPGKLTDSEFEIIKTHPILGFDYLIGLNVVSESILSGVLLHHAKLDGTGYPPRKKRDALPFYSRIIAIADVYDAITSYRSYRKPMPPADALELIMGEPGFDCDIVRAFIEKLEPYPINTRVELSNKKRGIVLEYSNPRRPVIQIRDSGALVDLMDWKNLNLVITGVEFENSEELGVGG
ncbi:MAG: HD-GYP domain-containing protein [Oscillospiraceae bacterium]|jgi:putative nucleotidyltransferase with HDIG domain|nr:HD-GYP domain-containing protein [Oscillospiraceae bacterium]